MHQTPTRAAILMTKATSHQELQQISKNYHEEIIAQAWECLSDKTKLRIKKFCRQSQTEIK